MDAYIKREIILENYTHPKNKGLIEDDRYIKVNMNNESCIDEVNLMVHVKDHVIKDIRFDGEACAICTSSTSIMIGTLIGKTLLQAQQILENFEKMLEEKPYNEGIIEEAAVYEDIAMQPNRKKCALLPWWGIAKVLETFKKEE